MINSFPPFSNREYILYFCGVLVSVVAIRHWRSKGNRVKIPDRPAAVSFILLFLTNSPATVCNRREGVKNGSKSEDLPVTANVFTLEDLEWDTCTYIFTVLLKTPEIKMVYAEVLYDVATIRKIQGFYLKDPPVASCRCFFLCLFGAELFWQKKSQAGFTCDFRNY